jgi:hypothetical protein
MSKGRVMHTRKSTGVPPVESSVGSSGWIEAAQRHYQLTGAYRADDLERVLGDVRSSVEVEATPEFQFAAEIHAKD